MLLTAFHGLCMAMADSVPGVSGGTIAFILGFYDRFVESLHSLFLGSRAERREGIRYLLNLGAGWMIGMAACVTILSGLFTGHIYFMSSLFMGLTVCSIPFIISAERSSLRDPLRHGWCLFIGIFIVVALTVLRSVSGTIGNVDFSTLTAGQYVYLFFSGAVAITAMVLPGISGSSILLIAGVYLPTIEAAHSLLQLHLEVLPGLCILGTGVIVGVAVSIHAIQTALENHRGQMVYLIIGLMVGSLYAIVYGPSSLRVPNPPMNIYTFQLPAFLLGAGLLLGLELLRMMMERAGKEASHVQNNA